MDEEFAACDPNCNVKAVMDLALGAEILKKIIQNKQRKSVAGLEDEIMLPAFGQDRQQVIGSHNISVQYIHGKVPTILRNGNCSKRCLGSKQMRGNLLEHDPVRRKIHCRSRLNDNPGILF